MEDTRRSESNSKVTNTALDQTMSIIPAGKEHNRCREALANEGAAVNIPDEDGLTPLMYAVNRDHNKCVNELVKAGADVNAKDKHGFTPLMFTKHNTHPNHVDLLIKAGADVNVKSKYGDTALNLSASGSRREDCLKLLIDAGADVNIANDSEETPLINSVHCSRNANYAKALIKAGADVNHANAFGETALMYAAFDDTHTELLLLLLEAGADVNIKDKKRQTALHYPTFVIPICHNIDILLKAGADVNNKTLEGESPLFSVLNGEDDSNFDEEHDQYVEAVNILIKAGADVNVENVKGTSVLSLAVGDGFSKCVKLLLEAGADVNRGKNTEGETALICATRSCDFGCLVFYEKGVDVISPCGHYKCLDLLLKAGADVNAIDNDDGNALRIQGRYVSAECYMKDSYKYPLFIKRLLRAGIHINRFTRSERRNALGLLLDHKFLYRNVNMNHPWFIGMKQSEINDKAAILLLYSAGETLEGTDVDKIPEVLQFEEEKLELKHICREAIRKHLLKVDPHQHLFGRVPRLKLPERITEYLLFNETLE